MTSRKNQSDCITLGIAASGTGGRAAVALARNGRLLGELPCGVGRRASEGLVPAIEELLHACGSTPADLACCAATRGPGSFTGIRVGLATAYGLSRAVGAPVLGFSTLETMVRGSGVVGTPVLAVLGAGRGEAYAAGHVIDAVSGGATTVFEPAIVAVEDLPDVQTELEALLVSEEDFDLPHRRGDVSVSTAVQRAATVAVWSASVLNSPEEYPPEALYIRRSWAEEARVTRG